MNSFEYVAPKTERELLSHAGGPDVEFLAGGTDIVGLLQHMVVRPKRVVNVTRVGSMRQVEVDSLGAKIGAAVSLETLADDPRLDGYQALKQAIATITSQALRCQGTLGGELCHRPSCWYFRSGKGLLANAGKLVAEGDNRHHAIFGNSGPAKFTSGSRLAAACIALDARVRLIGPAADEETLLPLEFFYRTPRTELQRENVLLPGQVVTHILLPPADAVANASYAVKHTSGPELPLASASVGLRVSGGYVTDARVVLGQVAPVPWVSAEAAEALLGQPLDADVAERAGRAAVAKATPLSGNKYKVQLAQVAVSRAILLAAGLETGGF